MHTVADDFGRVARNSSACVFVIAEMKQYSNSRSLDFVLFSFLIMVLLKSLFIGVGFSDKISRCVCILNPPLAE